MGSLRELHARREAWPGEGHSRGEAFTSLPEVMNFKLFGKTMLVAFFLFLTV